MALEKIRCPHCGASNVDVKPHDPCWKCKAKLNAPVFAQVSEPEAATASATPVVVTKDRRQEYRGPIPMILAVVIVVTVIALAVYLKLKG